MLELYFDESGNTGTNYLDDKQPYFIYGGWLIRQAKKKEICKMIKDIFQDSKAKELKAKNGIKNEKIKELVEGMVGFGAIPVFGVADKKYMVAAKIIETFFDHMYNPNVNGYLTYRSELKKALADNVSLNEGLLHEFSRIIHDGTIELQEMRKIRDMLSEHFKKEKLFEVQRSIVNLSDFNLNEMIKEFEDISKNGTEKRWLTLVLPTLMERLLSVDKYAELVHEKVNLYVDELWGYQNVFDEMEGILNRELFIKNIKFSGQCRSDENILIQAADVLCGFVNRTLSTKEKSKENKVVNEIWEEFLVIGLVYQECGIDIWEYYAHDDFEYEMIELAGHVIEIKKQISNQIIRRNFPNTVK